MSTWFRALSRSRLGEAAASHVVRRRSACLGHQCTTQARCLSTCGGLRASHPGTPRGPATVALSSTALVMAQRTQGSLQQLLEDPSDPYLAALQQFDIPRIAAIVDEGPATSAVPAAFLQRMGVRVDNDIKAATRAQHAAPTPLTTRAATSSAEAVLQSLHAAGAERQHNAAAAAADERQSAQAAYDALSAEEKTALQQEREVAHLFDGVCAISAAIRMQAEEGAASPEELDAVYHVYERAVHAYQEGQISPARWAEDFASEMAELEIIWAHLGSPRPLPLMK